MRKQSLTLETLAKLAVEFAGHLSPKKDRATVVALFGDLGAGKTAFAKALARAYGIEDDVTSPTFVIEKIYTPAKGPFSRLIHIDAYRLNSAHDLEVLGWDELLQAPSNLILVEWPENVERAIPSDAYRISLEYVDEHTRSITHDLK
ncbi:tRNA (adenosine(37)-N6)-threonylcarbamoyltransferase complex ATPase subunit type 1 TsaE [Candidatus Kaiserbacteria bacterium RIFCSPHIGHO2_02_FULL_49_16]|uniref:tRNA threonylcarbamoyladenosine biosynthesis protein TsaE n=1 Tax=Candidatus Kaiserbacteria bacterium RIFCSPHIGHO2_02_FULL_49_16 TaxID=1798490 RepID=A0A1F6DB65_9BACT|nr:MAG: tRNA (adenosine(37)-N6)-threonylcarbamoyltransferase complex ATPase subunit type 1 TsaE [Candidatus Kaiserbacteria bacterium RIFCSPHIGHO2_02_FULL_49_16]